MSFGKRVALYFVLGISVIAAAAAKAQAPKSAQPASVVKIYTIKTDPAYDPIYTDRKGCVVKVQKGWAVFVTADSTAQGDPKSVQMATVYTSTGEGTKPGQVEYSASGKKYDLTRESDLINRQCAPMLKAIPDTTIRKFALKLIVE